MEGCQSYEPLLNGSFPLISIDYKYSVPNLSIIERITNPQWVFAAGAEEWEIRIHIFRDAYLKEDDCVVDFTLINPQGGAVIGEQDFLSVYIYDVKLVDATESYALLNGEYNDESYKTVKVGDVAEIEIHSYLGPGIIKDDGDDIFFLAVIDWGWDSTTNSRNTSKWWEIFDPF